MTCPEAWQPDRFAERFRSPSEVEATVLRGQLAGMAATQTDRPIGATRADLGLGVRRRPDNFAIAGSVLLRFGRSGRFVR